MGAYEEELRAIAAAPRWDIPAMTAMRGALETLVRVVPGALRPEGWTGAAADGASEIAAELLRRFGQITEVLDRADAAIAAANSASDTAAAQIGDLPSAKVDPFWVNAARTASSVLYFGQTLPADTAVSIIQGHMGEQREEAAKAAVEKLRTDLAPPAAELVASQNQLREIKGLDLPPVPDPVVEDEPGTTPGSTGVPRGTGGSGSGLGGGPRLETATALPQPQEFRPLPGEWTRPEISGPSVDGGLVGGTLPGTHPGGLTGGIPGGSTDFSPGGSGGGLAGGHGSNGSGAGLIGGGAAAAAAAAAAKARAAAGGAGGRLGGGRPGGIGAGGLGGANGVGGAGSASGSGAAGGRLGAGGIGGAGASGAGGGAGTAGGAGRLGGGGLLGSQGGGTAGGGNTTVASTNAAGAGGRGPGGMMGGGGANEDRDKRGGLGGLMAPKLDDESDAVPRSAGASAGGRDQQPTD